MKRSIFFIIVINKQERICQIIEISIPDDQNEIQKEAEKYNKYKDVQIEIQRMWNIRIKIIPIVVGALGTVSMNYLDNLQIIPGRPTAHMCQKIELLGTASIAS